MTVSQCLALSYHVWPEYKGWANANGLDQRRGIGHGRHVVDRSTLPSKSIINLNILGSRNPTEEDWDYYNSYVGPNTPAKAKARTAAPAAAGGAVAAQPAVPKATTQTAAPKQLAEPADGGSLLCVHPNRLYSQPSIVGSAVRAVPKQVQGVVAPKERSTTVLASEGSSSAPSSVAVPKVPKVEPVVKPLPIPKQSQGVAVPKERDTTEFKGFRYFPNNNWCSP